MGPRLFRVDLTESDHLLHQRMVSGDLLNISVDDIQSAVTDIGDVEESPDDRGHDHGRSHTAVAFVLACFVEDLGI